MEFSIHPASVLMLIAYVFGLSLVARAKAAPEEPGESMRLAFGALAMVVATAGFTVAQTGIAIAGRTGLSETLVGMLLTAVATSLPELVTSVTAVRSTTPSSISRCSSSR